MSPYPDRSPARHATEHSRGFTLIEVMVSLGILLLVSAAIYPQVILGIRATGTARDLTQAKGVTQSKLEQMRSMPYYVGREAGDYIDILDTYYRNTTAPATPAACTGPLADLPPTAWTGYIPAGSPRCPWEPAAGAMYRKVINPIEMPGLGAFAMVVSTQFLAGGTPPQPIAPIAGYNSQTAGSDWPASTQLGVTMTVFYRSYGQIKHTSTYTQIERSAPLDPLIESHAKVAALNVSSAARHWGLWNVLAVDPAGNVEHDLTNLFANAGIVDLTGELFSGARTLSTATGAAASTSLPSTATGASTNLVAPADSPATGQSVGDVHLPNGCQWICFGSTRTVDVSAATTDGLPRAGTPTAPVRALIPAGANRNGVWFDNGKWGDAMRLDPTQPMVSVETTGSAIQPGVIDCVVGGPGSNSVNAHLISTGYLFSTPSGIPGREVAACGTAQSDTIRLFPTTFAPNGVVRVTLHKASAYCRVFEETTRTARADYDATVSYWNGSGYTSVQVRRGNTTDPLDSIPLNTIVHPASGLTLGSYIGSWSSLTSGEVVTDTGTGTASVNVPGVVTIFTSPTRTFISGWAPDNADPTSSISIAVGAVSCQAGDHR